MDSFNYEFFSSLYYCGLFTCGLFSLWMYGRHESFVGCISASGSLWFPGWINYLHTINRKAVVYLSLGRKESKTKNKLMCTVGQNTIETYNI